MDTRRTPDDTGTQPWFQIVIDHREIDRHMRRAQAMRAEAMGELVGSALLGIARLARTAVAPLARWRRQRATARELMAYVFVSSSTRPSSRNSTSPCQ